ncbi:MAG: 5'/3'-nucleotidase SurE [Candidatus Binatia bacterium]
MHHPFPLARTARALLAYRTRSLPGNRLPAARRIVERLRAGLASGCAPGWIRRREQVINSPVQLVLTNDDGIDAPGLAALEAAADSAGELVVVAPAGAQSGVGHQITTHAPIQVDALAPRRLRVAGTPADCARIALTTIAPHAAWLLSGINRGGNLGADVYTSGTVAAAREAALLGYRAIALSQYVARERALDWELTVRRVAAVLALLLARPLEPGHFWNVNLPHPPGDETVLPIVFCGLDTRPHGVRYRRDGDRYTYVGDYHERPRHPGRDVDVCMGGRIAVTKVTLEIAAAE